jgi:hypothetical protein
MKKKILLIALLFVAFSINAQTTFKFNLDRTTDYVVYSIDKVTSADIYKKAINWINETYKNPDIVIKAKIENEMIRIDGYLSPAFSRVFASGKKGDYDVSYTLEIQIQDGKYRMKYTHNKITVNGGAVYFKFADFLNNIPDVNGNAWLGAKEQYEENVNKLMESLFVYITKPKDKW